MNLLRLSFLLCSVAAVPVMAEDTSVTAPADATDHASSPDANAGDAASNTVTINGTTYQDVRWGRLTPTTVTLYHRTGIATMPLADLPPDLQKQFGYDPQKAAAWESSQQKAAAAHLAAEQTTAAARKAEEQKAAAAKAEADKQKALAANSAHTNAPPKNVQQNTNQTANRPTGGTTTSALKKRIQQSY